MAQYVTIEQIWDNSRFHCPVCGALVCTADSLTEKPCAHVLFSWIDEVGEFENLSPLLEGKLDFEDAPHPNYEEVMEKLPDTAVLFAFDIHSKGCGPITNTVVHAINFSD
jgi:hypothetical protein